MSDLPGSLESLMNWVAAHGLLGLVAVGLLERAIPVAPSHALLVATGVICARAGWALPMVVAITTATSLAGCALIYLLFTLVDTSCAGAALRRLAGGLRLPPSRLEGLIERCRGRDPTFAFSSQLLPVVREVAPAIAGVLRAAPVAYLTGSAIGIAVWNTFFIGIGRASSRWGAQHGTAELALGAFLSLLALELLALLLWRGYTANLRRPDLSKR